MDLRRFNAPRSRSRVVNRSDKHSAAFSLRRDLPMYIFTLLHVFLLISGLAQGDEGDRPRSGEGTLTFSGPLGALPGLAAP